MLGRLPILGLKNYNIPRHLSTTTQGGFKTVYKFPYIRGAGLVNRMKFYQTMLTSMTLPSAAILKHLGFLSQDEVMFTAILGLAGIIPLYGFGYFTDKLIGIVYLNENKNLVKFAFIDFWGTRRDMVMPVNEIVPFSESPHSITDPIYLKVQQFSSKITLKLCTRYGVVDDAGFNKIFSSYFKNLL